MRVEVSQTIQRSVDEVFTFYARDFVTNHSRWDPDMHLEQLTDGPIGVGTVIRRVNTHFGAPVEGVMEIVEYEPGKAMATTIADGPVEMRGRATFTSAGPNDSVLTLTVEATGIDESARDQMTGLIQRSLGNIKDLIESEPPAA
ncbi:MAG: SRPBCC family protein [Microbacteriaceae bacterium]